MVKSCLTISEPLTCLRRSGLALAKLVDLPQDIVNRAAVVSEALAKNIKDRKTKSKGYAVSRRRKLVLALRETLNQAHEGKMDHNTLRSFITQLQDEFVIHMDNLTNQDICNDNERNQ